MTCNFQYLHRNPRQSNTIRHRTGFTTALHFRYPPQHIRLQSQPQRSHKMAVYLNILNINIIDIKFIIFVILESKSDSVLFSKLQKKRKKENFATHVNHFSTLLFFYLFDTCIRKKKEIKPCSCVSSRCALSYCIHIHSPASKPRAAIRMMAAVLARVLFRKD